MEEFDSIPSDALLNRAESAKENADWPEAARLFAELHRREPENVAVLIFLARTRQELGDIPEAVRLLRLAHGLASSPDVDPQHRASVASIWPTLSKANPPTRRLACSRRSSAPPTASL